MELLALFNEDGRKISGKMSGVNYKTKAERTALIKKGYIVVTQQDFDLYCMQSGGANNRGYIRDAKTGKPVDAPAYVPSKKEKAELLYNECQGDLKQIDAQLINAVAIGDEELIVDLRQERADRIKQYQKDLAELEGGE